ncbi:hypothetical protein L2E82_34617 [Cichorium intybus]|uniref:Uncharacterized protein n=1 Tax=Cichorium intybus TaxID=13427 RepID=A0ACB9BMC8_CICIN|nr:hypothetical protein L2E82_34617 [Cichorium intybus]
MNDGRPVSVSQDQSHPMAIHGDKNMKRSPTFEDVAPDIGKSYNGPTVDAGLTNRGPGAVIQDSEKPLTFGDLAAAHKNHSGTVGQSPYEEVKIPTNSDMRPNNRSSSYPEGDYQYMSGANSYNGDNFGRFNR